MPKKANVHKLVIGPDNDTLFVDTDDLRIRANLRDNGTVKQYELNHEFEQQVEAFVARNHIIESGEINLDNWTQVSERSLGATTSGGFNPADLAF